MELQNSNQNKKTLLTLFTSMFAIVVTIVTNFFLSPYIVETLGEEANGFTQLANNFVNYASLITVALNSMAGRFITMHYYKGDKEESNKFYSSIMIANVAIICFLIIPALILLFKLESVVNIETSNVLYVKLLFAFVFGNFFVAQINSVLGIITYVSNRQYIVNTINSAKTVLNALCLLLFFSIFTPKIYYVSLVALLLSVITVPIYFIISRKILPDLKINFKCFSIKTIWQMFSAGIWNVVTQCGVLLMTGVDLLLANLLINPAAMGILSVSKVMPNCITQIAGNVSSSFSPNLTIAYAGGDSKDIIRSLRFSMKCSSILVSIPIMVLCIYGKNFYSLWQPTLNAETLSILSFWACIQYIPLAGPQALNNVFTATNKLKVNSVTVLLGGVVNIIAVVLLVKFTDLGLFAIAAISAIISIIRNLTITVPYSAKVLNLKWYTFYKDVLISCLCCFINGGFCFVFQLIIVPSSWGRMVISVFCACMFSLISLFLVLLSKEEKRQLLSKFKKRTV